MWLTFQNKQEKGNGHLSLEKYNLIRSVIAKELECNGSELKQSVVINRLPHSFQSFAMTLRFSFSYGHSGDTPL